MRAVRLGRWQLPPTSPRYPVASGSGGTVMLSWVAPSVGAPGSYLITATPGGATKSVGGGSLSADVTDLISADNAYHSFTVTGNGKISEASNPVMVGPDLGEDHAGQNLRVTWVKRTPNSTGWRPKGGTLTPWNPAAINGISLVSGTPGDPNAIWKITQPMTLTGLDIVGSFWLQADDVVFDRCRVTTVQGFRNYVTGAAQDHWQQGAIVRDCEVVGSSPAGRTYKPNMAFWGGPFTIQRCDAYGFGDIVRMSCNGPGDSGWIVEDNFFHDFWDGVTDDGHAVDTPHADGVQLYGVPGRVSGTVGVDNYIRRNTMDVRYPASYMPGTNGFRPRRDAAGGLNRALFWGTALGDIVCQNFFDGNILDGGGYPVQLQQSPELIFNADLRRNRIGRNYIFGSTNAPILLDGPSKQGRYLPGGSPYGSITADDSNVWDVTGNTTWARVAAPDAWVPVTGMAVVADTPAPISAP